MISGLLKLVLAVVLVVGLAAFFFGYRWADDGDVVERPVGTSGIADNDVDVDATRAREVGADVGENVAEGVDRAQDVAAAASLTAKIKAKMALDDGVRAAVIDVDTDGNVVTLSGRVASEGERQRALQLARETDGVSSVVDRLRVD